MSRVSIAGRDIAFDCESHETVLDAAERAGFAIPYSCRKGVCSTCEGDVISGTVMLGRTRIVSGPAQAVRLCLARLQGDIEIAPKSIAAVAPPLRKRFRASVHRIDNPAADVSILHLRLPIGRRAPFRAGQYVRVFLEDGESRNYSLANAPHDNDQVQLHVRHVPGGRFSEALLARLRPGDMLDLELPYGFFHLGEDSTRPLILLGTGTGFAPLRSIIEDLVRRRTLRPTHLFWGGRGRADLYEMTRPMRWAERHSWFRFTPVLSRPDEGWTGAVGRVQDAALRTYPDLSDAEVYACGNPAMVADARELMTTQGRLVADAFKADAFLPSGDAEEEQR